MLFQKFRKIYFLGFVLLFSNEVHAASVPVLGVSPEMSDLIAKCAPGVHPETMAALISAESRGNQYIIADAGLVNMPWAQRKRLVRSLHYDNIDDATKAATALIREGHTVSIGLTQVNDRNLKALGITIRDAFDPCVNVAAGGKIFTAYYKEAVKHLGFGERAMSVALSGYNSGDWRRGERDGYVNLVLNQRGRELDLRAKDTSPANRKRIDASTLKTVL